MRILIAAGALLPLSVAPLSAGTITPFLLGDQSTDQVLLARDLNGDGDTNDAGEVAVYFDAGNGSGLAAPTGNVFSLTRGSDGRIYAGDGDTDTVYRLTDRNGDGSANGKDEAHVWFSGTGNASGFRLNTPNGIAQGPDGAIYVVEADTVGSPSGDYVFRTVDLNGDGDANDAGEATPWLDLKAINASSSPFSITFDGATAYVADTAGGTPDVIYAAADSDGDGVVGAGEVRAFATEGAGTAASFDFAIDVGMGSVWTWEWQAGLDGLGSVFRLTDLDGSGVIDALAETAEVWNTSLLGTAFDYLAGFSMDVNGDTGEILITSNDSDDNGTWVIRLFDEDGDGAFWGSDEWSTVLVRSEQGSYPARPRAVAFYDGPLPAPVPLPAGLPLMAAALAALGIAGRRSRRPR